MFIPQCSYKYLLNSASIGYANKFKYLLLCGSVVIYVMDGMLVSLARLSPARRSKRHLQRSLGTCNDQHVHSPHVGLPQHKEFYEFGLLAGVHFVTVPTANDVPGV